MFRKPSVIAATIITMMSAASAMAKMTAEEVARLGKDLTPIGAEKAGNEDGSIPAWTGRHYCRLQVMSLGCTTQTLMQMTKCYSPSINQT